MEAVNKKRINYLQMDHILRALEVTEQSNFSLLPEEKIERGLVVCDVREDNETITKGKLYLSPGAKIKEHTHVLDWEEYIMPDGSCSTCHKGESHYLEGYSDKVMIVEFIKHK